MNRLRSVVVPTALSSGCQKLGQPVPLSNLVSEENSGRSQPAQCVDAGARSLVERAGEGALGAVLAQHVELLRRQQLLPLLVGLGDLEGLVGVGPAARASRRTAQRRARRRERPSSTASHCGGSASCVPRLVAWAAALPEARLCTWHIRTGHRAYGDHNPSSRAITMRGGTRCAASADDRHRPVDRDLLGATAGSGRRAPRRRRRRPRRRPRHRPGRCRAASEKRSASARWIRNTMTARWPVGDHVGELAQMLGAALGHAIGELGQARLAHQVHVLDLDVAGPLRGHSSRMSMRLLHAVFHLAPQAGVAARAPRCVPAAMASLTSLLGWPVLMPTRVGPCPRSASTISQVWRYLRVGLSLSESQTVSPGRVEAHHRAGVGAGGGDRRAVVERTSARKRL